MRQPAEFAGDVDTANEPSEADAAVAAMAMAFDVSDVREDTDFAMPAAVVGAAGPLKVEAPCALSPILCMVPIAPLYD